MIEGLNNIQIAGRLTVSPSTIKSHVSNILAKLGVTSRTEAVTLALRNGIAVSYTHLRAHATVLDLVCRLLLEKQKLETKNTGIIFGIYNLFLHYELTAYKLVY